MAKTFSPASSPGRRALLLLAAAAALARPMAAWADAFGSEQSRGPELSFGIVPQQAAGRLAELWVPLLRRLGELSGLRLGFKTAADIPTFETRLAAGQYDLAYMNPYHYAVFHDHPGYVAFAKERDRKLQGLVVVRSDSPLRQLADLDGLTLAFPAPAAFAASVLPRAELDNRRITYRAQYVASHDSVYQAVAKGLFPAGGGVMRTFDAVAPEIRRQLRVLWTTPGYTPHAFAAHPRVPQPLIPQLQAGMAALGSDPQGTQALEALELKGLVAATDDDWNDIRALKLPPLRPGEAR